MFENEIKIPSKINSKIKLRIVPGHFATTHSHINYYMDMTTLKVRRSEAAEVAYTMANNYQYTTHIDTIICLDQLEIIGAYMAEKLQENGIMSMNTHHTFYIISPEFDSNGQMIFRDNLQPMVRNKNILLLLASATTGKTVAQSLECIQYYGGKIQGVSAIFSAVNEVGGQEIKTIFTPDDLPEYKTYSQQECPFCQAGKKVDAIVNGYGYSAL